MNLLATSIYEFQIDSENVYLSKVQKVFRNRVFLDTPGCAQKTAKTGFAFPNLLWILLI